MVLGCVGRWCGGGRSRLRVAAALLCWAALAAVCVPRLQPPAAHPPRPPARLLLQSEPGSTTGEPAILSRPRAPTEDELRADAARRMPSLPLEFWHKHKDDKDKFLEKKSCAPFPSIYELEFADTYWQTLRASVGTFHVWGAYMDKRPTSRIGPAVRLLSVHDRVKPTLATHCQLWFEGRAAPVVVRTLEYKYVWNSKWGNYRDHVWQPFLIACVLPAEVRDLVPAAVSLVENACDRATNWLRVQYDPPEAGPGHPDHEFGVCVKGLDFLHEDLSVRLVEWLELVLLLGASRVHLYELAVHPNVSRVLRYYESRGLATVTPMTLPGGQPNLPALQHMYLKKKTTHKRQMELIPYNDCLYRHMYRYKRLVLLDIDEVIIPVQDGDWASLFLRIGPGSAPPPGRPPRSSYHASNLYFLDSLQHEHEWEAGAPRYMHMLQHVYRTRNFTKPGQYVKAFHDTSRVLALHNHFPLACLGGACSSYAIPTETARLQHYRADCVTALSKTCADLRRDPVRDMTLWRWKEPLVARVDRALRDLGFLSSGTSTPTPPQR